MRPRRLLNPKKSCACCFQIPLKFHMSYRRPSSDFKIAFVLRNSPPFAKSLFIRACFLPLTHQMHGSRRRSGAVWDDPCHISTWCVWARVVTILGARGRVRSVVLIRTSHKLISRERASVVFRRFFSLHMTSRVRTKIRRS